MKIARLFGGFAALCALAGAGVMYAGSPARSFDLQSSPTTVKRPTADITDTYFSPAQRIPITSSPLWTSIRGQGINTYFDQKVLYTMHFDNKYGQEAVGSRPIDDEVLQFSFGAPSGGTQAIFIYGPAIPTSTGPATKLVNSGNYTGTGFINRPFTSTSSFFNTVPFSVFAGARRDPSFFNSAQYFQNLPGSQYG